MYKKVLHCVGNVDDKFWFNTKWKWAILTLEIPEGELVVECPFENPSHKCRVGKAKVIDARDISDAPPDERARFAAKKSSHINNSYHSRYNGMEYVVGETVEAPVENPETVCGPGIHCFKTPEEAENYWFT